eukprot:204615_1
MLVLITIVALNLSLMSAFSNKCDEYDVCNWDSESGKYHMYSCLSSIEIGVKSECDDKNCENCKYDAKVNWDSPKNCCTEDYPRHWQNYCNACDWNEMQDYIKPTDTLKSSQYQHADVDGPYCTETCDKSTVLGVDAGTGIILITANFDTNPTDDITITADRCNCFGFAPVNTVDITSDKMD